MFERLSAQPQALMLILAMFALALLIPSVVFASQLRRRISDRLGTTSGQTATVAIRPAQNTIGQKLMEGLGRRLGSGSSEDASRLRAKMIQAGYFSSSAPFIFTGIRVLCILLSQVLLFVFAPFSPVELTGTNLIMACFFMAALGYLLPNKMVDRRIEAREQQYRDGFPDMMDLLVACVEAGLSLDAAILRISDELKERYPFLGTQLYMMSLEMRAGRDRSEAWNNFAARLGLDEARSLATMLKQSEDLGTSVGETLRIFANDMRERRMLYAEEKALALPAKLVLPLILFVFPTLLTVLMMPAVVRMMWVFEAQA